MIAYVFVDADVLISARDPRDPARRSRASEWLRLLWNEARGRTSIQVLNEYYDSTTRKLDVTVRPEDAWDDVQAYLAAWNPQATDAEVLACAHEVQTRYRLDWWDCLVVGAAQVQRCVLLLSESLQDGAEYGGVVVRSPVTLRVAEESGAYVVPPPLPSRHRGRGRPRTRSPRAASG